MADKKDGHREYAAERKANIIRLTEDLRSSESQLSEFVGNPDQTATKYNLRLTTEEVAALAALAGSQELDEAALAAVAGGTKESTDININCGC